MRMRMKTRNAKKLVEIKNMADNTVYSAEKLLRENGDKVPADIKKEVEDSVAKVKEVLNGDNAEALKTSTEALQQVIQKVGASMYQQPGTAGEAPTGGEASGAAEGGAAEGGNAAGEKPGDVVDGEFKNI